MRKELICSYLLFFSDFSFLWTRD